MLSVLLVMTSIGLWQTRQKLLDQSSPLVTGLSTIPRSQMSDPGDATSFRDTMSAMERQMDSFMQTVGSGEDLFGQSRLQPKIQVEDDNEKYLIDVQVPDGQKIELNTELHDKSLVINGRLEDHQEDDAQGRQSYISRSSEFSRSIYLPDMGEQDKVVIDNTEHGVEITVPKALG